MSRSDRLVFAFFGVFGMGVAFGYLMPIISPSQSRLEKFFQRTMDPKDMADRVVTRFTTKFNLTPGEQTAIKPVVTEMTQQLYQDRVDFGNKALADEDAFHAKLAALLNPEHRAQFDESYKTYRAKLATDLLVQPNPPVK